MRTIEFVLDRSNGKTIYAENFFLKPENEIFNYRNELQKAIKGIREPLFVCYFCSQNIKIIGGGITKKTLHFAHKKDSDFCHLKTDNNYSRLEIQRVKYNGAKESPLHFETKNLIKKFIESNDDFSDIKVEKVLKSNSNYLEWKKPDISAKYGNVKVVFEIQLSTTFLSVIVDREHFYKENQTYILWVFKNFEIEEFKQRFTEKDVFYSNNRNAFVLDNEAINLSQLNNDLYLLCYYQKPTIQDLELTHTWESEYISFSQLTFDSSSYKIFYYDVDKIEYEMKLQVIKTLNEKREKERSANEEKIKKQAELELFWEAERIRQQNEKEKQKALELQKEEYLFKKQQELQSKILNFKEVNHDFYLRLETNYLNLSEFQKVFLSPVNELTDSLYKLFVKGYEITQKDKVF